MKTISAVLFILAAILVAGCKSGSVLTLGGNTVIKYQQFDKASGEETLELVLVEESNETYKNLYSKEKPNANTKLIPADKFSLLLQTLEDLGYVEMANPRELQAAPRLNGANKAIVVQGDLGMWMLTNDFDALADTFESSENPFMDFHMMERAILNCYDSVLSLQVVTNEKGGELFFEEQRRLQEQQQQLQKDTQ